MRRFAPQLFAPLFCISFVLLFVSDAHGQMPTRRRPQPQIQNQDWIVEILRQQARLRTNAKARDQEALRNDFRQLQIVNNNLMTRMFQGPATEKITNSEIKSSLGEIKKLAERLRYSFGIPKAKTKAQTDVALAAGLLALDKAVTSFVDNPWFQQPRVYDTELVSQAGRDLNEVLRLANGLRKLCAEKR